ncbi:MAG: tRNA lysidine(34) synthetase TilS [Elusimicrobiaceae bacterium]|jgi:tRNA(Ile)-lysidine synthase
MDRKSFHARVWGKVKKFTADNELIAPGARVLVAFSSGPDSVCLAHFLSHLAGKTGFSVALCHVNHGLRENAVKDEKFAREFAKRLGAQCVIKKAAVKSFAKKHRLSTEHAARKLRYELLEQTARKLKCSAIATGHHLDDQAETVMLNLIRGVKAQGLSGMPVKRPCSGGRKSPEIIRPLLCLTRAEILLYLKYNDLPFRVDESNECEDFTRNWIRKTLIPLIETKQPRFKEHLRLISDQLRELTGPKRKL